MTAEKVAKTRKQKDTANGEKCGRVAVARDLSIDEGGSSEEVPEWRSHYCGGSPWAHQSRAIGQSALQERACHEASPDLDGTTGEGCRGCERTKDDSEAKTHAARASGCGRCMHGSTNRRGGGGGGSGLSMTRADPEPLRVCPRCVRVKTTRESASCSPPSPEARVVAAVIVKYRLDAAACVAEDERRPRIRYGSLAIHCECPAWTEPSAMWVRLASHLPRPAQASERGEGRNATQSEF